MKRNMDLIRDILLLVEGKESAYLMKEIVIENHSENEISYHLDLLSEAGLLLIPDDFRLGDGTNTYALRLTWNGHEFLEAAKDKKRWDTAKKFILDKAGSLPFSVLQNLLIKYMNSTIEL